MPASPDRRLILGPFNRVEGDLEVRLDIADGRVRRAEVNSPMYRGFEQMLEGREAADALVIVPRICGICSVSQSIAAARALAELAGIEPPPNGAHAINLMGAVENVADHLSHFYLFFMPDFARPAYAAEPWFAEAQRRYAALAGERSRAALAARQRWFTIVGTLGGKWPHTQSIVPGGSTRAIDAAERRRLLASVRELRRFLETTTFGAPLEAVAALDSRAAFDALLGGGAAAGDLGFFAQLADALALDALGPGPGRYLSVGAYPLPEGGEAFHSGFLDTHHGPAEIGERVPAPAGTDGLQGFADAPEPHHAPHPRPLSTAPRPWRLVMPDPAAVTEDVSHAWYAAAPDQPAPSPAAARTLPDIDRAGAYSWAKAPRYAGRVLETGAIARQLIDGQPLVEREVMRSGANVWTRVLARLVETARIVIAAEGWLAAIRPGEPFHVAARPGAASHAGHAASADGFAVGRTEAARGSLLHYAEVRGGRIANWQIVAPTTWNFSPRDAAGTPGALEAALVGTEVNAGDDTPVRVQHVVRSFDPCMVCTVH
ncbi:nickel-dependent hydrogenase large subunit [Derxia gummosa]|uniref:Nickel-dependent hydrogenase large subunit n=1 Tax=Derxia gummosa DSM 723 TaxID=1121388 RepID=A0A8B6X6Y9_9BURK|nr:nickel-dependent hydrogenase large subunit [Derxia gummosa]